MLRKGTPGEGWQGGTDSFSYTPVQTGTKGAFAAWLAGDVYWSLCHEHTDKWPGTKPCLDWITHGELRCPRCNSPKAPTWIGYVPLYREQDHAPLLVLVHENAQDLVRGLSYPDHVLVGRVADKSGVYVRKSETAIPFRTENANRKRPIDVTSQLLKMWKLPQLEEWLARQSKKKRMEQEDAEHNARLRLSVPPPTTDVEALAIDAEKKDGSGWSALVDQALKRRGAGKNEPSSNGKHGGDT